MGLTKWEIIKETKEWYDTDPNRRAVGQGGACMYYYEGCMCAVGRCFENPIGVQTKLGNGTCSAESLGCSHDIVLDEELKEEYRGHSDEFWQELQNFHDTMTNWDDKGITKAGLMAYNSLLETYGND